MAQEFVVCRYLNDDVRLLQLSAGGHILVDHSRVRWLELTTSAVTVLLNGYSDSAGDGEMREFIDELRDEGWIQ